MNKSIFKLLVLSIISISGMSCDQQNGKPAQFIRGHSYSLDQFGLPEVSGISGNYTCIYARVLADTAFTVLFKKGELISPLIRDGQFDIPSSFVKDYFEKLEENWKGDVNIAGKVPDSGMFRIKDINHGSALLKIIESQDQTVSFVIYSSTH